jgi:Fic family protein
MKKPYIPEKLPPAHIDWVSHVPSIAKANAALARYDGILETMVNPVLLLSPLTTQEAVLSSRIEGTQATLEEVLEFETDPTRKIEPAKHADIHEIINYRTAINKAVELLDKKPLCLNLILELHNILMDGVRGANKARGQFRRTQNWIGPAGCTIEEATFIPPAADVMTQALDDWEKYIHQDEKDRLVQLAVVKAQFELIHPFLDGNGRIGRMLVPLFLFEKKLLSRPMFYMSAYLERNRAQYYQVLNAISERDDWNGWIRFFLHAVIEQAKDNTKKAKAIISLYEEMKRRIPAITRSRYAVQIIDAIFYLPIFTTAGFAKKTTIPLPTAKRIVDALAKENLLRPLKEAKGRQGTRWVFAPLLGILNMEDTDHE